MKKKYGRPPKGGRVHFSNLIYPQIMRSLVTLAYLQERPLYEVMETAFVNYLLSHDVSVELDNIDRS